MVNKSGFILMPTIHCPQFSSRGLSITKKKMGIMGPDGNEHLLNKNNTELFNHLGNFY